MYPEGPEVPKNLTDDLLKPPNKGSITPDIGYDALPNRISLIPIHTK